MRRRRRRRRGRDTRSAIEHAHIIVREEEEEEEESPEIPVAQSNMPTSFSGSSFTTWVISGKLWKIWRRRGMRSKTKGKRKSRQ